MTAVKKLLAATLAGASLVLVSGCSGSSPSPSGDAAADAPVTLTVALLTTNKPGMDAVIADFEEQHPNITVEANYYESGDAYTSAVPTQFASGNGTDIVQVLAGDASPYSTGAFAAAGYLADLSDEAWVPTMYEPTKPLFEVDGKVLAKDIGIQPLSIMSYNRSIFEEHGIEVPTTFDEMLGVCADIAALGITPVSWAGGSQPVNANNVATMAGNTVFAEEPDWLAKRASGDTTFAESAGWRRALEQLTEMIDGGCFSPGAGGVALADMLTEYGSGQAAMMFTSGGLNGRVLEQAPQLDIGMFPLPGDDADQTRITVQSGGGLGVWADSPNLAAANTFLEFLSSDEESTVFTGLNQLISNVQATGGDLPEVYTELEPYFTGDEILADVTAQWPSTQMNTLNGASIQGLFTGQKTVDDVLADLDANFEEE